MTSIVLKPINETDHFEDALDLALRAADYVVLEVGHAPDAEFIHAFFTATPPDLEASCLLTFAVMEQEAMAGMVCVARGYEFPDDWWIGLLLVDPTFRGRGIGTQVVQEIRRLALEDDAAMLKLAVLCANPRALKFWLREGFEPHRFAPATPDGDGHDRIVLKHALRPAALLAAQ